MRCFIHIDDEAIAACRKCGKGMCSACSAYSGHSGICPECRKEDFVKERIAKTKIVNEHEQAITGYWIGGILLCWTIIAPLIFLVKGLNRSTEKKAAQKRIDYLASEIEKLNNALKKHTVSII